MSKAVVAANIIKGLTFIAELTEVSLRVQAQIRSVNESILKAQEEGRDLSDEEINILIGRRKYAVSEWNKLLND